MDAALKLSNTLIHVITFKNQHRKGKLVNYKYNFEKSRRCQAKKFYRYYVAIGYEVPQLSLYSDF